MTTQTDVLAWLDSLHATDADGAVTNRKWPEAQAARAAVAALMGAGKRVDTAIMAWRMSGKPDLGELNAAQGDLIAALANMEGQP